MANKIRTTISMDKDLFKYLVAMSENQERNVSQQISHLVKNATWTKKG